MAQNALTVTTPNPTPPTNFSFTGVTGPNPPNYTLTTMNDLTNWGASALGSKPVSPPPFYDDGTAGSLLVYAANTAALAGGSGGTAGGTNGTYPGTGSPPYNLANNVGAVPASTSLAHEGAGSEVSVTAPGSVAAAPTIAVSCLGSYTNLVTGGPNSQHASSFNAAGTSTISSLSAGGTSGPGTTLLTVTGTNFRRDSVVNVNGIPQTTNYASATSISVTNAPKKATAGNVPVTVTTGGVTTGSTNWVFT